MNHYGPEFAKRAKALLESPTEHTDEIEKMAQDMVGTAIQFRIGEAFHKAAAEVTPEKTAGTAGDDMTSWGKHVGLGALLGGGLGSLLAVPSGAGRLARGIVGGGLGAMGGITIGDLVHAGKGAVKRIDKKDLRASEKAKTAGLWETVTGQRKTSLRPVTTSDKVDQSWRPYPARAAGIKNPTAIKPSATPKVQAAGLLKAPKVPMGAVKALVTGNVDSRVGKALGK